MTVDIWSPEAPTIEVRGRGVELRPVSLRVVGAYNALVASVQAIIAADAAPQTFEAEAERLSRALSRVVAFDAGDPMDWPLDVVWAAALGSFVSYMGFLRGPFVTATETALKAAPETGALSSPGSAAAGTA